MLSLPTKQLPSIAQSQIVRMVEGGLRITEGPDGPASPRNYHQTCKPPPTLTFK